MDVEVLPGDIKKVELEGALDISGTEAIGLRLSTLCGSSEKILMDFKKVHFLASIGIRSIVMGAKTLQRRGGKLVIAQPQPDVLKVLQTTAIDQLIPIFPNDDEAMMALSS